MYNKIYLEAEKKLTQKKAFIVFVNEFTNTFLIDSVQKVFLEKYSFPYYVDSDEKFYDEKC